MFILAESGFKNYVYNVKFSVLMFKFSFPMLDQNLGPDSEKLPF